MKLIMENWRKFKNEISDKDTVVDEIPAPLQSKKVDPTADTIDDPRSELPPRIRFQRQQKLEALQSRIELRNAQQVWLDEYHQGKPFPNVLDEDGEEYHVKTLEWSIGDIRKLIKFFNQGLGLSGIQQQATQQRQRAGVTPPEGLMEFFDEDSLEEKKKKKKKQDACYHKVKRRYKVWPSAYASGALVRCRKVGAKNWGNKSKKKK